MPAPIPELHLDFDCSSMAKNPYPTYQHILTHQPVCRLPAGYVVVSRYDDVVFALHHSDLVERITNDFREPAWLPSSMHRQPVLLTSCPVTHRQHRNLFRSALSTDAVDQLRPLMKKIIESLLESHKNSSIDFMADIAFPYVAQIMNEVTGLHHQDLDLLRRWARCIESVQAMGDTPPESFKQEYMSLHDLFHRDYQQVIDARKKSPQDDFISHLLAESNLSDAELRDGIDLMVFAGFDTTALQLGITIHELINAPELFKHLKIHPDDISGFNNEMSRYRSVSQATLRRAIKSFDLPSGQNIPADTVMWVSSAAANHDFRVFCDPEEFKLDRPNSNDNLNFGSGSHMCIGKKLGEAELHIAIEAIVAKATGFRSMGPTSWSFPLTHRVIDELPIQIIS